MKNRPYPTEIVEIPGVGHAPALLSAEQVKLVKDWILQK
jgi:hypothetical protein